jgi:hypothetical protein
MQKDFFAFLMNPDFRTDRRLPVLYIEMIDEE